MGELTALAPAKINLFLHVGPVDRSGYHPLASLAVFADVGDGLSIRRADRLRLVVEGPFAAQLGDPAENLVARSLRRLGELAGVGELPVEVILDKQLPLAAGLGGGSSDAGAALKLVRDLLHLPLDDEALAAIAAEIGADGPMCLHARAAWAEGRGERLDFEDQLPPLPALLVNPLVPSPTGAVYAAYDAGAPATANRPAPPEAWDAFTVRRWLSAQRNDLEAPAVRLQPEIRSALHEVADAPGVRLTRMSGSGATVFGLFDSLGAAAEAAAFVRARRPAWWVRPTLLR